MNFKRVVLVWAILGLILTGAVCKRGGEPGIKAPQLQPEWYRYISGYSSGMISRKAPIRVLFVDSIGPAGEGAAAPDGVLDFSPSFSGKAVWTSAREISFTPDSPLKPGVTHKAVLRLDKVMDVPREFRTFEFVFTVIPSEMEINVEGLGPQEGAGPDRQSLQGVLTTSDSEEGALVEKVLKAEQDGRALDIAWTHDIRGQRHVFLVKNVARGEAESSIGLKWDGAPLGLDQKGERQIIVPSINEFKLLEAEAVPGDPGFAVLRFSDLLQANQDLEGLIRAEGLTLTFEAEGSSIRVYSASGFGLSATLLVSSGIRNFNGRKLDKDYSQALSFKSGAPEARFVGKGTILPQKDRLTVPIETLNLKSIQVTAFQIYGDNIHQFFQVNNLEGTDQLTRVGRFLWRKTVPLTEDPAELRRWTRFNLDVTQLLKENPGSLFRLTLSFNRGNSAYQCPPSTLEPAREAPLVNQDDTDYRDASSWDYAEDYYDEDRFNWQDREDPCKDTYYNPRYNSKAAVSRNFIASNIGLIASQGEESTLHVVTTDIRTGQPLGGARVRAFDFQNRPLAEGKTDGSGFVTLKPPRRPFYISAQSGQDIGYLRINKDAALAMSHFDVGGETVVKGVKGAIYGERGVWRPGDTLFLTFVLFDRDRVLPPEHPVTLELYNPRGQLLQTLKPVKSLQSFHSFQVTTDETAPTGVWNARVLVGGLSFDKALRIETVVPNRLKIQFKAGADILVEKDMPVQGSIASQWLHGAPASGLKFDVRVRFSSRPTRFASYQDYIFDDPAREFSPVDQSLGEGKLDAKGEALFPISLSVEQPSPGMLQADFLTRVFEETGEFSTDTLSLPYHPYSVYVGLKTPKGDEARGMLLTDTDHAVNIVTLDPAGKPVSRDNLEVRLYKIEWKWWWDKSGESLAQYASASAANVLLKGTVSTKNGVGTWSFRIKYPDWGRYLIRVYDPVGGHASGKVIYIDWPGWAGRAREEKGAGASRLNFTADKQSYRVGEKAVIYLPEAPQGRALVSLENGSSVIRQMWVSTKAGENRFEIALEESMSPNIYVHVTLLQPHSDKKADTPIRLYGVIPLIVENPKTQLTPIVRVNDELRPPAIPGARLGEGPPGHDLHPGRRGRRIAGPDPLRDRRPPPGILQA